jgi:hypothetical protein
VNDWRKSLRNELVAALLGAAAVFGSIRAEADPATAAAAPEVNARVSITLVGRASLAKELDDLLLEWFDSQQVRVDIRRQASLDRSEVMAKTADTQTLRIWMTLVGTSVRLYYADPAGERFLVRNIPLRNGLDEVGREHVVQVLVTSAEDFVSRRISSTAQEVEASLPPPPPAPPRPVAPAPPPPVAPAAPSFGCGPRIGPLYAVTMRGAEGVGNGPGAVLGIACASPRVWWALSMSARYELPTTAHGTDVSVKIRTLGARWTLAIETPDPRPLGAGVEIGGGVDHAAFEPSALPGATVTPRASGSDFRPVALFAARGSLWQGRARLTLSAGIAVPLLKTHYDVAAGSDRLTQVTPWRVEPTFTLEASWR